VTVKEGDRVRRGQVLVRLDEQELRAQIARARATLQSAEAKLSQSRNQATWKDTSSRSEYQRALADLASAKARVQQSETTLKLVESDTKTRLQTAQSLVQVARQRLAIAKEATRKQELRQAQLGVDQAKAEAKQAHVNADNARQMFERRQKLFAQDAIAKEEVDEAERRAKSMDAAAEVADASVDVAMQKLELAREGSRPEEVRVAEEQVRAADQALEQAQNEQQRKQVAQNDVEAAKAAEQQAKAAVETAKAGLVQAKLSVDDINNARATVAQSRADIAYYQAQLDDLTIVSPVDGVVSTRSVHVGEMVTTSSRLMDLVALNAVFFEAAVPELEVGYVRPGANATVTIDSLAGKRFAGAVREVIPVATPGSRSFRVRVAVLGGAGRIPAGGFARAKVHVGTHANALVLRKDALQSESGDKFVWLIDDDGKGGLAAKRQPVKVGLVNDREVEILSGLREGQRAITAGSPAIVEGTPLSLNP
jgi:multidrug resistance efflux pump